MGRQAITETNGFAFLITLATALGGGIIFHLLNTPIPWLLGPMIAVLIGTNVWKGKYRWPGQIRNTGMIIVGYTIGLSMTGSALREMGEQLPTMCLMTVILLLLCGGIAYAVSKLSDTDFKTALLGSIPGGLSQVLALAEETKGVNLTVVTVTQVVRLMIIVIGIPLLVFSPVFGQVHDAAAAAVAVTAKHNDWAGLFPNILVFAPVCALCAIAGNRINFPTAFLLGPALATAILQGIGLHGPSLPAGLISAAQLMIGTYVGLLLKPGKLQRKARTFAFAIGSGLVLMLCAWGLCELMTLLHPVSRPTALLSLAPGGMDQMGILAHEINADLSMVSGYQLFRTFFIFFAVPPLLRLLFRISPKGSRAEQPH
ncbi:AbrB family transcriptional regulator [Paenibacillus glycanilyticus]|uniref:AbrB family transcriptional regulator n=1 Tax=Paenibacillus glycanilyticus TaxID=126569 RepID=UPI00203C3BE4|nr:AbrB family transcriptional regulator [Paenibacillus glycanilyticus]MCM3627039.1 AbrB family transcriptional regulator [Paenibacillus glycanilyticus]